MANFLQKTSNFVFPRKKEVKSQFKLYDIGIARTSAKLDDYLGAIESAINPETQLRYRLYSFYERTLLYDTYTKGLIEKRLENITNKNLVPYDLNGNKVEVLLPIANNLKFTEFIKDILMLGKFWGLGLLEVLNLDVDEQTFDYGTIKPLYIDPYKKIVLDSPIASDGDKYDDRYNILEVGGEDDLGLLLNIVILSLYKRMAQFNYAKYVDLASENFTKLKVKDFGDEKQLQKVQQQINDTGARGTIQLPPHFDAELVNTSSSTQNALFENYLKELKEELAIYILGQTMTTSDGSSRAQAEVHQEEQEDKFKSDERFIINSLQNKFNPILPEFGITNEINWVFELTDAQQNNINLRNYERLKDLGIEFTDEELRNKFNHLL